MDKDKILKQCCTDKCIWDDKKVCHKIEIYTTLTINDFKFLSTINVHTLDLFGINVCNDDAKILTQNKTLHTLILSLNKIGNDSVKYLAKNKTLHTLVLYSNYVSDDGVKYLAKNKTLNTLLLYNNYIGDDGAKYLAQNKTLHYLDLRHNDVGDIGAKYLANNKTLYALNLRSNKIGDIGANYFTKSRFPCLTLDIKYNYIDIQSKSNYLSHIDNIRSILMKHIIKDITNIIICYIKYNEVV